MFLAMFFLCSLNAVFLLQTWQEFFLNVQDTNFVTLGICLASIVLLVINEEFVKVLHLSNISKISIYG